MRRFRILSDPQVENEDDNDEDDINDNEVRSLHSEDFSDKIDTVSNVQMEEIDDFLSLKKSKIDDVEKTFVGANEFEIQTDRIRKIFDGCFWKLKILGYLPILVENQGEILKEYFDDVEVDFILKVCGEKKKFEDQLEVASKITDILDKVSYRSSARQIKPKTIEIENDFDAYVAQVVHLITTNTDLVEFIENCGYDLEQEVEDFFMEIDKLRKIVEIRLRTSGSDEIDRFNKLKTAYRTNLLLKDNIEELEKQIQLQRLELGKENDKKAAIMKGLSGKIEELREKFKVDVNQIVYDSEKVMMLAFNKSESKQLELAVDAKQTTQQYDTILEDHLEIEKSLRAKCFKVETQLASWLAKYDQDIGEKQAEQEVLQKIYDDEKAEVDELQMKFDEQEEEYTILMQEKEEEEQRIFEEMAYQFLLNRSARRIQRAWRAYKIRKAMRKKKRKKKGSADKRKGSAGRKSPRGKDKTKKSADKKKKAKKGKKDKEDHTTMRGGPDPNALLESKFNKELLEDIKTEDAFGKKDFQVDLSAD